MNPFVPCFRKFPVVKKLMDQRGGEYQYFLPKIICLTVRKISVGGGNPLAFHSFRASIKFG